ncbi:MAG: hypothetical protein E7665_04150 [Ruminococcaceae bacterium]|nr:hypothetical protein [Oscillospiraceae bacterium]
MTERALSYIPLHLREAIRKYPKKDDICEIRLRAGLPMSLTMSFGNIFIDKNGRACPMEEGLRTTKSDVESCVNMLCEGSAYRHIKSMKQGFIMTDDGLRAGISASFLPTENENIPPSSIGSVNIRIPRLIPDAAGGLMRFFSFHAIGSSLIFSPPGHGKTTLIRDLAIRLSKGELRRAVRVCVIDSRGEIFPPKSRFSDNGGLLDIISGCSKAEGIEKAVRVLSPEVLICDEIGSEDDSSALLSAHSGGVILIASCHGDSISSVKRKPHINKLITEGLFTYSVSLTASNSFPFKTNVNVKSIDRI